MAFLYLFHRGVILCHLVVFFFLPSYIFCGLISVIVVYQPFISGMKPERHHNTNHPKPCLMWCLSYFVRLPCFQIIRQSLRLAGATEGPCCTSHEAAQGFVQSGLQNLRGWRQHRLCAICSAICLSYFLPAYSLKKPKAAACRMHRNGNRAAVEEFEDKSNHACNFQKFICGDTQGI